MKNQIIIRQPNGCSAIELEAFVAVAVKGEEVEWQDIQRGARRAVALLWMEEGGVPFAVAALKMPFINYKQRVFRKAGILEEHGKFSLELGYIYVEDAQRGNGYGPMFVQEAIRLYGRDGIYATTRTDNVRMQDILKENGFSAAGAAYLSSRNDSRLLLFIRPA